jgi:hypothetical protein
MNRRTATAVPPAPTFEDERRRGALAAIKALKVLAASADDPDNCGEEPADFFSWQHNDAATLADSLGPMPEYLRGAIMALAEYIHLSISTGEPNMVAWLPVTAMTQAELQREVDRMRAAHMEASTSRISNVVQLRH